MPNYAPKTDLKKTAGVDTSDFAKKIVDLANLKSDVGKLDIDKLKIVATNLNNLKIKVDKLDIDKFISVHSWNSLPPIEEGITLKRGVDIEMWGLLYSSIAFTVCGGKSKVSFTTF